MSEILSREDAVRAFLDGKELELNYKCNMGFEGGWVRLLHSDDFWAHVAHQSTDFRLVVPKAAFKKGEFAYLVSSADAVGGWRYGGAFTSHRGAMFVEVIEKLCYIDGRNPGWTYNTESSDGTPQVVHERDLRKAAEVGPRTIVK